MDAKDVKALAIENGFHAAYIFEPSVCKRPEVNQYNEFVSDSPEELLAGVKSVIVLLMGYDFYKNDETKPTVSAYYPVSNAAYHAAKNVGDALKEAGYQAVSNAQIAIKPFLLECGLGETGENSLVSVEGFGTKVHIQIVLTDAELEKDEKKSGNRFSSLCASCRACVKACPAGALLGKGALNTEKCLRAKDSGEIVPEELRPLYKNRILGCDICQSVCPRNKGSKEIDMPEDLEEALSLKTLLQGNVSPLEKYLGRNYARRARIRMKAALAARNLNRLDLLEELKEMAENGTPGEKEHAVWAIEKLTENSGGK